jgi:rod shape-determining protein MreD
MPRLVFALLILLLALVQTTLLPLGRIIGITPDLVLVALLLWSAAREPREGLLWAFGIGLFLDLLTLAPLGSSALALLPVVVIGWLGRNRFFQSGLVVPLLLAMAATLAHGLALLALAPFTGGHVNPLATARLGVLGATLNALVVPPLYLIVQLVDRWIGRNDSYARA